MGEKYAMLSRFFAGQDERGMAFLYRMTELKEEQLVDEMIAILEDRDRIIKKHEMEQAQAAINRIYNEGLE